MRRSERQLQDELCTDGPSPRGGASVFRTRTRVDTGGWLGKSRVRVCLTGDELVLFAAGRRPFVERIPVPSLGESFYNHVTGEVALAPAEGARVKRLRIRPVEGYALLGELGASNRDVQDSQDDEQRTSC